MCDTAGRFGVPGDCDESANTRAARNLTLPEALRSMAVAATEHSALVAAQDQLRASLREDAGPLFDEPLFDDVWALAALRAANLLIAIINRAVREGEIDVDRMRQELLVGMARLLPDREPRGAGA